MKDLWWTKCPITWISRNRVSSSYFGSPRLYNHTSAPQPSRVFLYGATPASRPELPHYPGFTITLRHTTLVKKPLDELSARRRDLYLTTRNTKYKHPCLRRDSNPISGSEQPQTHALDGAATGITGAYNFCEITALLNNIQKSQRNLTATTCNLHWKARIQMCYTPVEMWWHTVTHERGSEGETGECSG